METNKGVAVAQPMTAKSFFERDDVKRKFNDLLGKRSTQFITSVMQVVTSNTLLSKADATSIYQATIMAATLDLPINNSLGFAYIVPYGGKAQFQIGWKGLVQLCQRSGQFKTISATPIYEGQIISENPLTGFEFDFSIKSTKVVGYAAHFELINGFAKTMYMSSEQINTHAKRFSKTFNSGAWQTDFDAMATKTVLKQLLSKYAPMSIEIQRAVVVDQAVIKDAESLEVDYVDNTPDTAEDKVTDRIYALIEDAQTLEDLKKVEAHVPDDLIDFYQAKKEALTPTTVSDGKRK